jgi:hypothetical protein
VPFHTNRPASTLSTKRCGAWTGMAYLIYPSAAEVQLRLGPREDTILGVVRRWQWWIRADVERTLPDAVDVTGVTLTAERTMDRTMRDILFEGFHLVFPDDGGEGVVQPRRTRGRRARPGP